MGGGGGHLVPVVERVDRGIPGRTHLVVVALLHWRAIYSLDIESLNHCDTINMS